MADERYLENARVLLRLVDGAFPDWTPETRTSLISVALGVRVGEAAFPNDPRSALVQAGMVIGAAAACVQREMTKGVARSCEGRA